MKYVKIGGILLIGFIGMISFFFSLQKNTKKKWTKEKPAPAILEQLNQVIQSVKKDPLSTMTDSVAQESYLGDLIKLSKKIEPYLVEDTLVHPASPERGQLLSYLSTTLDSTSLQKVVSEGDFSFAVIEDLDLTNASLTQGSFSRIQAKELNGTAANLEDVFLDYAILSNSKLDSANLERAYLKGINMIDCSLQAAKLKSANFIFAKLNNMDFKDADLTNVYFFKTRLKGATFINTNLTATDFRSADLRSTDFTGAQTFRTDFKNANLSEAILSGLDLSNSILIGTNLKDADLTHSIMGNMNINTIKTLKGADLSHANLSKCFIRYGKLLNVKSLYETKLPDDIRETIEEEKPCLFKPSGCVSKDSIQTKSNEIDSI